MNYLLTVLILHSVYALSAQEYWEFTQTFYEEDTLYPQDTITQYVQLYIVPGHSRQIITVGEQVFTSIVDSATMTRLTFHNELNGTKVYGFETVDNLVNGVPVFYDGEHEGIDFILLPEVQVAFGLELHHISFLQGPAVVGDGWLALRDPPNAMDIWVLKDGRKGFVVEGVNRTNGMYSSGCLLSYRNPAELPPNAFSMTPPAGYIGRSGPVPPVGEE
jgi:hypothetical protein